MRLTHFAYKEKNWQVDSSLQLQEVNLLIGDNAVGKSRTIRAIGTTISYILQQIEPDKAGAFSSVMLFEDNGEKIFYSFTYYKGEIDNEDLIVDSKIYLKRTEKSTRLHTESINPPANKLTLHVRRDVVQYPYIEKIIQWAEYACGIYFNETDSAGDNSTSSYMLGQRKDLYAMVKSMSPDILSRIINQANKLGYPLKEIKTIELGEIKKVTFFEKGIKTLLIDSVLSKGMFRTLYLLIYMEYLSQQEHPSLLLVDDLCEGLDYNRSTKLGKLIFNFCLRHHIQLIASSNDTFLMDVIDLKYWNILRRKGGKVYAINVENSPELFNDFKFTGLSNFDFFSSDYIERHTQKKAGDE